MKQYIYFEDKTEYIVNEKKVEDIRLEADVFIAGHRLGCFGIPGGRIAYGDQKRDRKALLPCG